ncbi:MAG: sigma-70 family RNA polymerase sigma factor [Anaerolineae bacterium]
MSAELEREWALSAIAGNDDAYAKLVEAYQLPVFNLAYRMLGSATEAEDAAQETFIRAYDRLRTFDTERKFSNWILSIASHYCVDRLRRRRGVVLSMEEIMGQRWIPDEAPKPEEQTLRHEERALIRQTLEDLPAPYRLVIVLRYWNDLGYEEIAEITNDSVSAVKSRLHRAREMMADSLRQSDIKAATEKKERRYTENVLSRCI